VAGSAILSIKILTDASQAKRGLDASASSMDKFKNGLSKAAVPAALVGAAILKFGKDAVESASRTQQAMGGVEAVFGKNARVVERWAAGAASSIGLAKSEYGELATVIGSQLSNAGLPLATVTKETGKLISKGADLAAMFGGTTAEAVDALSSAMKGEFDPLEKYGTSLSAAKIAAQQAAEGTDKLTGKAAAQAKMMATLHLVQKQTAKSAGAAAREQDTYAARTQQFAAEVENLKSDLGTALLPVVAAVVDKFSGLAKLMSENIGLVQIIVGVIATLAGIILILNAAMKVATVVTWAMNAAMAANPVVLIALAIVALIAVVVILYKKVPIVKRVFDSVFATTAAIVRVFARLFTAQFRVAISAVTTTVRGLVTAWRSATAAIRGAWKATTDAIRAIWRAATTSIRTVASSLRTAVVGVWDKIAAAVSAVVDAIGSGIAGAIAKARAAMSGLGRILAAPWKVAQTAIDAVKTAVGKVIAVVESLISALGRIKVPKISLPHIPGVNLSAVAPAAGPSPALRSARGGAGAAPRATAGAGGTVVNIYGAVDPEGTARAVQRVLDGHGRRVGLRTA
jgi:phage-related protein